VLTELAHDEVLSSKVHNVKMVLQNPSIFGTSFSKMASGENHSFFDRQMHTELKAQALGGLM
jgi:hypothetical protein